MADYKIRYSLYCNNCVATRYTGYEDYSDPIPDECPICSSENIKDVAIVKILNQAQYAAQDEGTATTQETTPQTATSLSIDLEAGVRYKVHWYCELKISSNAIAYARLGYQGSQGSGVTGEFWNSNSDFLPFSGIEAFEAQYSENTTIALQFWSSNGTKVASIKRRRIFVEKVCCE